jgi:hypothetical protein
MYQDPTGALLLWQLRRAEEDRRRNRRHAHANGRAARRIARRTDHHVPATHHEEHIR